MTADWVLGEYDPDPGAWSRVERKLSVFERNTGKNCHLPKLGDCGVGSRAIHQSTIWYTERPNLLVRIDLVNKTKSTQELPALLSGVGIDEISVLHSLNALFLYTKRGEILRLKC
jgi:hypothetical protein